MSYPAPDFLEDDPWFGPAFRSQKAKKKFEVTKILTERIEATIVNTTNESSNIHEKMYSIATKSRSTTLHLDPIPVLGGGSENVWQSGAGW